MEIGRRIYYDKQTGNLVLDTGERSGAVKQSEIEDEIATYIELAERVRGTFDVLELEYGAYAADFAEGRLVGVDPETKELNFEYPNPEEPAELITPAVPLSKQIEALKEEGVMNMMAMVEMYEKNVSLEQENAATMLAVTEIYELIMGGG